MDAGTGASAPAQHRSGGGSRSPTTRSSSRSERNRPSQRGSGSKSFRGGRGGGGRGARGRDHKGKSRDLGRSEWSKTKPDKRTANEETKEKAAKRQKLDNGEPAPLPVYATKFDQAELDAEERRPKKKVAVLLGYSGTGYKGMQLAPDQKTIEGDLFKAFVDAGAISKANADDPKKSSFVRCARTDKGVHAAGNIISLKLIVGDEDIVRKINDCLVPQIRIWGFVRTNNSFSSYQMVDSRIYEYLIPTHSFLPPHPKSFLGRKCKAWAEKTGEVAEWEARQDEVQGYWEKIDEELIGPILNEYSDDVREILQKALWLSAEQEANKQGNVDSKPAMAPSNKDEDALQFNTDGVAAVAVTNEEWSSAALDNPIDNHIADAHGDDGSREEQAAPTNPGQQAPKISSSAAILSKEQKIARRKLIEEGVKRIRAAYVQAKRAYRIPEARKQRLQEVLNLYLGTKNFWNYTIQKTHGDPSAKRVIKSFKVNMTPILIDGTEWLSLKVHGQSFMMHQIRKMVGMAALVVRCGCSPSRITESYRSTNFSIPKAPSLGLLLERPVFDSYNKRAAGELQKDPIDFDQYKEEMDAFKQKFIYERMYHDEERENVFGNFFNHVDNFPSNTFLFVTSGGLEASGEVDGPETGASRIARNHHDQDEHEQVHAANLADLDSDDELDGMKDNAGDEG